MSERYIRYLAEHDDELQRFETSIWVILAQIKTLEDADRDGGVRQRSPSQVEHAARHKMTPNMLDNFRMLEIYSDDLHDRYKILEKVAKLRISQQGNSN